MNNHHRTAPFGALRPRRGQKGVTLIVALIFLLIFAVVAAQALNGSMTSARAIGNMQWRKEAVDAANDAIERLLSSSAFALQASVVTAQFDAAPPQVDVNGDGVPDVTVTFPQTTIGGVTGHGPRCVRAKAVPDMSLNPDSPSDRPCFGSRDPNSSGFGKVDPGSAGGTTKPAEPNMCASTEWMVTVQADDQLTNTSVTVTQGVGVRVMRQVANNYCN